MRSFLARLTFAGLVGAAVAGCGTNSTAPPVGALPNGTGGGSSPVTLPASSVTPAPFSIKPLLLDSGAEPSPSPSATATDVWKPILTNAPGSTSSDAPSTTQSTQDPPASGAPSSAPTNPPQTAGSHDVTFAGSGSQQVILQFQKTLPDLVYSFNNPTPGSLPGNFSYSTIVIHLAYLPAAGMPALASVAAGVTGSISGTGAFDVRVSCTGTPGAAPAFGKLTCSKFPALNAVSNEIGPNPIIPGAAGPFDPVSAYAPKLNLVLNYATATSTAVTGNTIFIDNVYATQ